MCRTYNGFNMNNTRLSVAILITIRLENPHAGVRVRFISKWLEEMDQCTGIREIVELE